MKSHRSPAHLTDIFPQQHETQEEEPASPTRKKSVRFDAQIEAPPTPTSRSRSNSASASPKPVLKRASDAEEVEKFSRKMSQVRLLLERLKKGDALTKYYEGGTTKLRHFYVSDDGSELRWCAPRFRGLAKRLGKNSSIILAEVRGIVFGPRTERFSNYDWLRGTPHNCFSVICERRTLDIECKTREQFMVWFLGLQALSPLSHKFWNRGQLNWHRSLYKTLQMAGNSNKDISTIWKELVDLSRKQITAEKAILEEEKRKQDEENQRILDEEDRPVRRKSSLKEESKEDPIVSDALKRVLYGDTSVGSVAIRERLAKEAMSFIRNAPPSPSSELEPTTSSRQESTAELLTRKHSDDLDEKEEFASLVDLSIITAPIDPSRFQKSSRKK